MKGHIKQKLYSLASGELVALAVFWFNFLLFKKWLLSPQALISIAYPLPYLATRFPFLVDSDQAPSQAQLCDQADGPDLWPTQTSRPHFILLALGMPIILMEFSSWPVSLIAMAIWLIALIEWINYFHWQLSYSLNPLVLLSKVAKRKLRKSKIAKEIDKSK